MIDDLQQMYICASSNLKAKHILEILHLTCNIKNYTIVGRAFIAACPGHTMINTYLHPKESAYVYILLFVNSSLLPRRRLKHPTQCPHTLFVYHHRSPRRPICMVDYTNPFNTIFALHYGWWKPNRDSGRAATMSLALLLLCRPKTWSSSTISLRLGCNTMPGCCGVTSIEPNMMAKLI